MKRFGILMVIVAAGIVGFASSVHSQPNPSIGKFMRQKLDHSQKVLEGITLEDYAAIERNSVALAALSQASTWQVLKTPEYVTYSAEFLQHANALTRAAREKNIDAATLAYVQLTLNCVNCHKHVRATRMASLDQKTLR
ncbi:MAG: hypothetical protein U1D30_20190 [Planctomycetota bacterium]